ncbi:MAG: D-glycero-beta-D-manno-heptose 1-phosphate adenylyltransferase [Bacteroidetes bacterium]|nr:D-glycero-beta-D-manno-heptose 1-phosphate adenylyltransferase [Bacteroidota bacterium]
MRSAHGYTDKLLSLEEAIRAIARWRLLRRSVVFTNGCFDILHAGHLDVLERAAALGDLLVVGLNGDASVRRLKGNDRPVNDQAFRSRMLACLSMVDAVVIFDEDTPRELIEALLPDILVKGGDYRAEEVVGAEAVVASGGRIEIIPLTEGYSTTGLIAHIRSL